jgi:hypothetical protein
MIQIMRPGSLVYHSVMFHKDRTTMIRFNMLLILLLFFSSSAKSDILDDIENTPVSMIDIGTVKINHMLLLTSPDLENALRKIVYKSGYKEYFHISTYTNFFVSKRKEMQIDYTFSYKLDKNTSTNRSKFVCQELLKTAKFQLSSLVGRHFFRWDHNYEFREFIKVITEIESKILLSIRVADSAAPKEVVCSGFLKI